MSNKISLHRALSELKVIEKRIEKALSEVVVIGANQKGKKVLEVYTEEDFAELAKARLQSARDLIDRKVALKSAINKANAETVIEIGGLSRTIADAIAYKHIIGHKKKLVVNLESHIRNVKSQVEQANTKIRENAQKLAENAMGKDNVQTKPDEATQITESYLNSFLYEIVDPLGIEKTVEHLHDEVNTFEGEIDAVLSEVNATTFIEV